MLKFSQLEIETELRDCFLQGDIKQLAIRTGISDGIIGRELNPETHWRSAAYLFLQIQSALDEIDPARGECHWDRVVKFREMSKPRTTGELDRRLTAVTVTKETNDVACAHMNDLPLEQQYIEANQAVAAAEAHRDAIGEAIEAQKGIDNVKLRGAANR